MILYDLFYRRSGFRRPEHFLKPPFLGNEKLELPKDSIFHFLPTDSVEHGPSGSDPVIAKSQRLIMVEHVGDLTQRDGPPKPTLMPLNRMTMDYQRKNRNTRPMRTLETAIRDSLTLLVVNYAMLTHMFRYTTSVFSEYYRWNNIHRTMWNRVATLATQTNRHQFIRLELPDILPTYTQLIRAESGITRNTLDAFRNPASLLVLDLWRWLGVNRQESALAQIDPSNYSKINILWEENGQWFVLNLAQLDKYRKSPEQPNASVEPKTMQKRFLRMMIAIQEIGTVSTVNEYNDTYVDPSETDTPLVKEIKVGELDQATSDVKDDDKTLDDLETELDLPSGLDDASLDEALGQLDRINERRQEQLVVTRPVYEGREQTPEEAVLKKSNEMVDMGLMSAAEYRRMNTLAGRYKEIKNPYGEGTLETLVTVAQEDLKIVEQIIPDKTSVLDKSMLSSSLLEFDSRYIRDILKKDIAGMVLNVQQAGIAITGYEVEQVEDVMNHYEHHTVRFVPVSGKPSTVRFRVPVVKEDGTFKANGVLTRLRKQRGDLPIRKVSPTRAVLTSYHSKVTVERARLSSNNYAKWLINQILALSIQENPSVTNVRLSNVFKPYAPTGRTYSTMATRFQSFQVGDIEFFFDYDKRISHFGADVVTANESDTFVIVGLSGKNVVLIDNANALYLKDRDSLKVLGTIEDLLNIDGSNAPIDTCEISIYGKKIPIGVMLAYEMGLENLIDRLGVEPRRVNNGERLNLSKDEYAIRFQDETLVFTRDNVLASMILGGFNHYDKTIRNYSVYDFDRKDVYFSVLENNGIGIRYLREIDLMYQMFIDPITKGILVDMNEPTEVVGLLIRACELLMTDQHPAEMDMREMRIKGYERIAGLVYGEMVKAVRGYQMRGYSSEASVNMSPHAVWQAIGQDPSASLVEQSNPIQNLKEKEAVTFSGTGGRSARSMVARTRIYHKEDMGVISEATVDSSSVAINTFLSADPQFKTLRGVTKVREVGDKRATTLLSTSALISPASDRDDPKRVN